MKIYLSGPMTGLPELNYPEFHKWADKIRAEGDEVYNPADNPQNETYTNCMRMCLPELFSCDKIAVLEGWHESYGSTLEVALAKTIGIPIIWAHSGLCCDDAYEGIYPMPKEWHDARDEILRTLRAKQMTAHSSYQGSEELIKGIKIGLISAISIVSSKLGQL